MNQHHHRLHKPGGVGRQNIYRRPHRHLLHPPINYAGGEWTGTLNVDLANTLKAATITKTSADKGTVTTEGNIVKWTLSLTAATKAKLTINIKINDDATVGEKISFTAYLKEGEPILGPPETEGTITARPLSNIVTNVTVDKDEIKPGENAIFTASMENKGTAAYNPARKLTMTFTGVNKGTIGTPTATGGAEVKVTGDTVEITGSIQPLAKHTVSVPVTAAAAADPGDQITAGLTKPEGTTSGNLSASTLIVAPVTITEITVDKDNITPTQTATFTAKIRNDGNAEYAGEQKITIGYIGEGTEGTIGEVAATIGTATVNATEITITGGNIPTNKTQTITIPITLTAATGPGEITANLVKPTGSTSGTLTAKTITGREG